ncbi:MAG: acyl--CoA ligase [Firmicutes bacterium]|nr:acyl--CoA ligase [Bacillota bacterium]
MNLATALELAVHRYPEAEAIITPTARFSYQEWNCRINVLAWKLLKLGVEQGDSVAICAANGEGPATAYFAVQKIGATAVFLHSRWKHQQLAYALNEADAVAVFYDHWTQAEVKKAASLCRRQIIKIMINAENCSTFDNKTFSYENLVSNPTSINPGIPRRCSSIGTILYTSGTTGEPKGVCRSCSSDYFASLALILGHRWSYFERVLAVMPLYHTMGLHTLISMVLLNGACILLPQIDPAECIELIESEKVSALYLVPTVFHDLTRHLDAHKRKLAVTKLAYAGAPMAPSLVQKCRALFSPEVFVNQYGCTEMLAITINADLLQYPLSAGRPALHSRIRIVAASKSGSALPHEVVPQGEIGEIIVDASSPQAFSGYLKKPEKTKQVLRDGWYYTGDLGFFDSKMNLHLSGRLDNMIISGGENIYPHEVESVLLQHSMVREAAVIGLPDKRWGEVVAAFIVPAAPELDQLELDRFCLENTGLARYKRPRKYYFVQEIPKSAAGKVLYFLLKKHILKTADNNT